jgi:hypothetical protein
MNTEIINEYDKRPMLSPNTKMFVESYDGGPVPPDIKAELTQYLLDIEPYVEASKNRLSSVITKAFRK